MRAVPVDGGCQARLEVAVLGLPAELVTKLRPVDRVPQVVAGPVGDVVARVAGLPHQLQDQRYVAFIPLRCLWDVSHNQYCGINAAKERK